MAVKHGSESDSDTARAMLTNRLLSDPLDSEDDAGETQSEHVPRSFMEIEHSARSDGHNQMSNGRNFGGNGGPQEELSNHDARYLSSNEWIS